MFIRNSKCRWACYEWKLGKILYLENELLRLGIFADKGTDIFEILYKPSDIDLMFRGPFPVFPLGYPETINSKSGKFLNYFAGGWQEVFPNGGVSTVYKGAELGLHGEVALLPWDFAIIEDTPETIKIKFTVRTHRTPFSLEKTLTLKSGSAGVEISETVVNEAGQDMDFIWGHHPAFGEPFLSGDCEINIKGAKVTVGQGDGLSYTNLKHGKGVWPRVEGTDGKPVDISRVPAPDAKVSEVIFLSELEEGAYEIINRKLKLGFRLEFPKDIFRYLYMWRVAHGSFDFPWYGRTYNLALEPFSSLPNLAEAVKRGDQLTLGPGKSLRSQMKFSVFTS